jgi:hypothetical protein
MEVQEEQQQQQQQEQDASSQRILKAIPHEDHLDIVATTTEQQQPDNHLNTTTTNYNDNDNKIPPMDVPVTLALAKLCFKGNNKPKAMELCMRIVTYLNDHPSLILATDTSHDHTTPENNNTPLSPSSSTASGSCDPEDAADAYHLAGWIRVHDDDHTSAYRIWNEEVDCCPIVKY